MFESDFNNEERPRKRRLIDKTTEDDVLKALIYEEIDVEIGLRARLKETIQSRLTWAVVLQNALEQHFVPQDTQAVENTSNHFADVAIAAYKETREPAEFLITGEPLGILDTSNRLGTPPQIVETVNSVVQEVQQFRHATRVHHEDRVVKGPNKYLFLRDVTSTPTMVYKIECLDCHRSDFPRLQGLLNHCRLKHRREFGSHDECVQACAIVVPEEEQAFVISHGLEVMGMSASLQRLFKMAVGSYEGIVATSNTEDAEELVKMVQPGTLIAAVGVRLEDSVFATKTLGHHKDTPALAPFLGRAPKKRQINVYDDDTPLDVLSMDDKASNPVWQMPYKERGLVDEADSGSSESDDLEFDNVVDHSTETQDEPVLHGGSSRFHIVARLIISDWSKRITAEKAKKFSTHEEITHKWMISIVAPSYSFDASTVLIKVTVTSATYPPPTGLLTPLSVCEPPYCIMGITSRPFLARITLEWTGTRNKPTQIDHWVELDLSMSSRPVRGDEQTLDLELDRHTELRPRKDDVWKVDWYSDPQKDSSLSNQIGRMSGATGSDPPAHIKRLKNLLQRFPMTDQDLGLRRVPRVPYFLPPTPQHFEGFVEGRKKAIEWGRARALWDAYASSKPIEDLTLQNASSIQPLDFSSPMEVYRWMKTEDLFQHSPSRSQIPYKPFHANP